MAGAPSGRGAMHQPAESPHLGSASQQGSCLWIGDLSTWMDENWLRRIFAPTQALVSCKVIRHKTTQMSRGYGFLLFDSPEAAHQVLAQLNGTQIPGTQQVFRLNLAASARQGSAGASDHSLFVGDLAEEVTDIMLQEAFRQFYPSVRSAKVMRAPLTGKSRNFGFCRFGSEPERDRALVEMQGQEIAGRPVRVSLATAKKTQTGQPAQPQPASAGASGGGGENATLFVGGLSEAVSEAELQQVFSLVGELASVKLLLSRGCAFVQYRDPAAAKAAMTILHKQVLAGSQIRISWGKQGASQQQQHQHQPRPVYPVQPQGLPMGLHPGIWGYEAAAFDPLGGGAFHGVPGLGGGVLSPAQLEQLTAQVGLLSLGGAPELGPAYLTQPGPPPLPGLPGPGGMFGPASGLPAPEPLLPQQVSQAEPLRRYSDDRGGSQQDLFR